MFKRFITAAAALFVCLTCVSGLTRVSAADSRAIVLGATAGPYADQIKFGIKPILEKRGYRVRIVEFHDYVQPNLALAEGSLDANVFQNRIYLQRFAEDHKLDLTGVVKVPTVPMALYSKRHRGLDEVASGATVALPNDPTNQARALAMLARLGWIQLKPGADPLRVSERDIAVNTRKIKVLPLEAAQLPRALEDVDYAFVNGNYAIAAGLKLSEAVKVEDNIDPYIIVVTVRTGDKDKAFVQDLAQAYRSPEFYAVIDRQFPEYVKPKL